MCTCYVAARPRLVASCCLINLFMQFAELPVCVRACTTTTTTTRGAECRRWFPDATFDLSHSYTQRPQCQKVYSHVAYNIALLLTHTLMTMRYISTRYIMLICCGICSVVVSVSFSLAKLSVCVLRWTFVSSINPEQLLDTSEQRRLLLKKKKHTRTRAHKDHKPYSHKWEVYRKRACTYATQITRISCLSHTTAQNAANNLSHVQSVKSMWLSFVCVSCRCRSRSNVA